MSYIVSTRVMGYRQRVLKPNFVKKRSTSLRIKSVKSKPPSKANTTGKSASLLTDRRNRALTDWREDTLDRMRALIFEADHEMIEERKWKKPSNAMQGVPVWSHNGIVCTGETYTKVVKLTFAQGAKLPDPCVFSIRAWKETREGR